MTDRQQTIIEMAQILSNDCGHCEECNCVADNDINCTDYYYAKQLYNAGYRKVGENAVVSEIAKAWCEAWDKSRAKTAKEILDKIDYESNGQTKQITDLLRKQFGVEVQDE